MNLVMESERSVVTIFYKRKLQVGNILHLVIERVVHVVVVNERLVNLMYR